MLAWFLANWSQVLVALLAIDVALIPIFPSVTLFQKIKEILSGVVPPK